MKRRLFAILVSTAILLVPAVGIHATGEDAWPKLTSTYLDYMMRHSMLLTNIRTLGDPLEAVVDVEITSEPLVKEGVFETRVLPYSVQSRDDLPSHCVYLSRDTVFGGTKAKLIGPEVVYPGMPVSYTLRATTHILEVERFNCWTTYRSIVVDATQYPEGKVMTVTLDEIGPATINVTYRNAFGFPVRVHKQIEVQEPPFRMLW